MRIKGEDVQKYSGPEDVYKDLVDDSTESWLLGLLAFAVVEEQKVEWMRHYSQTHEGNSPNAQDIRGWYEQQPQSVLLRAKGTAENALSAYSEEVLALVIDDYKAEVKESIIMKKISDLGRFLPQLGANVVGGLVSSILFAALLISVAVFVLNDVSPIQIGENLKSRIGVIHNGQDTERNK